MALAIPIISEFDGTGVNKAIKQFQQLETTGEKAQFVLKKAAVGAGVALAGLAVAIGDATKAAMEDAQAQSKLAEQLRNVTGATNIQIASAEKFIGTLSRATGVADDNLRPALAALVRGTKDIAQAQDALTLATDISVATNRDLVEVSNALAMAYQGNMRGLRSLSPEMAALIKEGASLNEVMNVLGGTFGGAAAANAETAAGKMQIFRNSMNEAKESLGAAFLPILEAALPKLQRFADWAMTNTDALKKLIIVIGATTAAVIALNIAMNVNPFVLAATYTIAATVAMENFKHKLNDIPAFIRPVSDALYKLLFPLNALIDGYNSLAKLLHLPEVKLGGLFTNFSQGGLGFVGDNRGSMPGGFGQSVTIPSLGGLPGVSGSVGGSIGGSTSGGSFGGSRGGSRGTANFGPQGMETLGQGMGIGTGWDLNKINLAPININIEGGLATSAEIGAAVVDAIKQYTNVSGPADIAVR